MKNGIFKKIIIFLCFFSLISCGLIKRTREKLLGKSRPQKPSMSKVQEKSQMNEASQDNTKKQAPVYYDADQYKLLGDLGGVKVDKGFETVEATDISINEVKTKMMAPLSTEDEAKLFFQALDARDGGQKERSQLAFSHLLNSSNEQIKCRALYYSALHFLEMKKNAQAQSYFQKVLKECGFSIISLKSLEYTRSLSQDSAMNSSYDEVLKVFAGVQDSFTN